jgi:CheY-like chemotaxis protein
VLRESLEDEGYTVLEAVTPEAAESTAKEHEGPIHLMLTDVVMPRVGGVELAERVREARPDIQVLFMSGYSRALGTELQSLAEDAHLLHKPFSVESLLRKLRELLDT